MPTYSVINTYLFIYLFIKAADNSFVIHKHISLFQIEFALDICLIHNAIHISNLDIAILDGFQIVILLYKML